MIKIRKHEAVEASALIGIMLVSLIPLIADIRPVHATLLALHVCGTKICDASNAVITLRGLNWGEIPGSIYETCAGKTPAQQNNACLNTDATNIANAGFNWVSLNLEWGDIENSVDASHFTYNASTFSMYKWWVGNMTAHNLYVNIKMDADYDIPWENVTLFRFLGNQICEAPGLSTQQYQSRFSDAFYQTNGGTTGIQHLRQLWQYLDTNIPANSGLFGYDFLNEPTTGTAGSGPCQHTVSEQTIRTAWHTRIQNDIIGGIRAESSTKIGLVQEAPFFDYYGDPCCNVFFTPNDISDTNWITTVHSYREEVSAFPSWKWCYNDYPTVFNANNATATTGGPGPGACVSTTAIWVIAAMQKYPSFPFIVGEYADLNGNSAGDALASYNINVTRIFAGYGMAGWAYWSNGQSGSWPSDTLHTFPFTVTSTITHPGLHQFSFSNPTITGGLGSFTCSWVWGDSTTNGSGCNANSHTYAIYGTWTVTLTVTDSTHIRSPVLTDNHNTTSLTLTASDPAPTPGADKISKGIGFRTKYALVTSSLNMTMQSLVVYANGTLLFNVTGYETSQQLYRFNVQYFDNGTQPIIFIGVQPLAASSHFGAPSYSGTQETVIYTQSANAAQTDDLCVAYGVGYLLTCILANPLGVTQVRRDATLLIVLTIVLIFWGGFIIAISKRKSRQAK